MPNATSSLLFEDLSGLLGSITYGDYRFPSLNDSKIDLEPLYDKTGKVRTGTRVKVYVKFLILPGMENLIDQISTGGDLGTYNPRDTTDDEMDVLKAYLEAPGRNLFIDTKGFGDLYIYSSRQDAANSASTTARDIDIEGGPTPRIIGWVPVTNKMAMVTWECESVISGCSLNSPSDLLYGLKYRSYNNTITTSVDKNGLSTRDVTGTIEITSTAGDKTLQTADEAIKTIDKLYPHLHHFTRTYPSISISEDRKKVQFSMRDEEIASDTPYFPGLTSMSAKFRTSSTVDLGFSRWACSLDFRCEVQKANLKDSAFVAFGLILKHLYGQKKLAKVVNNSYEAKKKGTTEQAGYAILTELSFEDDIFGREVTCSASWDLFCSLPHILKATGLFRSINSPGRDQYLGYASWTKWKERAEDMQNAGGFQDYVFTTNYYDEWSPSACNDPTANPAQPTATKGVVDKPRTATDKKNENYSPDPEDDMAEYTNQVSLSTDEKTYSIGSLEDLDGVQEYSQSLSQGRNLRSATLSEANPSLNSANMADGNSAQEGEPNVPRHYYSKTGKTQYFAKMVGRAIRLGRPCPIPSLVTVGAQTAIKVGKDYTRINPIGQGMDENGKTYVIYETIWAKKYLLSDAPKNATIVSDGAQAVMPS